MNLETNDISFDLVSDINNNKTKYQKSPDNLYPVKIYTTTDNNSDKILIEFMIRKILKILA